LTPAGIAVTIAEPLWNGQHLNFKEKDKMLVLSRKPGEKIHIGTDITITVASVQGNRVRIGIEAPDQISIVRNELQESFNDFRTPDQMHDPAFDSRL